MKKKDYNLDDEVEKVGAKDALALIIATFQIVLPFALVCIVVTALVLLLFTKIFV